VIIFHVLQDKEPYTSMGSDYFDKLDVKKVESHRIHRLEQLGYTTTLAPKEAA
jgi:transposase